MLDNIKYLDYNKVYRIYYYAPASIINIKLEDL